MTLSNGTPPDHCHALAPLTQRRQDATAAQFLTQWLRVIALVSLHLQGALPGLASLALEGWNSVYQGKGLGYIMNIGSSELHRQGDALSLRDNVVLASGFSSIGRIGSGMLPPNRPY
jgi:hypothetical protein